MLVRVHVSLSCSHAPTPYQLSISSGGRQKEASLKTAQAKETPGAGAKKEIAESTAPKVDAVEVQVTSDGFFGSAFGRMPHCSDTLRFLLCIFFGRTPHCSDTYSLNALQMRYDACVNACI
jgi:hypothetical protein